MPAIRQYITKLENDYQRKFVSIRQVRVMQNQRAFILIELIAAIVLTGIIASFTAFFLYTGFNGYEKSKNTSEGTLNAQMALDRITLELRNIGEIMTTPAPTSASFTYKSEALSGTRALDYDQADDKIEIEVNNTPYTLLEDVPWFNLSFKCSDLDNDGTENDLEYIEVAFKVGEIEKKFRTKIFPRNMVGFTCP
jgi:type II secretory pathway pseudopilin PulG